MQPLLEESSDVVHDGILGTDHWVFTVPAMKGRIKAVTIKGLLEDDDSQTKKRQKKIADGKGFPDIDPYSYGIYWPELDITFPEGVEVLVPKA